VALTRSNVPRDVLLYTTDNGEAHMRRGTLPGAAVITMGDFAPGSDVAASFAAQRRFNPPGLSPDVCTESVVVFV
jgi:beta-galactosidase